MEKLELRAVLTNSEDIKFWEEIKKILHIRMDTEALRTVIRSYHEIITKNQTQEVVE